MVLQSLDRGAHKIVRPSEHPIVILAFSSASVGMRTSFRHHSSTVRVQPPSSGEFPKDHKIANTFQDPFLAKLLEPLAGVVKKPNACRDPFLAKLLRPLAAWEQSLNSSIRSPDLSA